MTTHPPTTPETLPPRTPPVAWVWRVLMAVVLLAMLSFLCVYIAMGTVGGSRFLLETVADKAGVKLTYQDGTLRDGVTVGQIFVKADMTEVHIDKATLTLGWRAILARRLHINSADVGTVRVVDNTPPSDELFGYPTIATPVPLFLENTKIATLQIEPKGISPVVFDNIVVQSGNWQGSKVSLDGAEVDIVKEVKVSKAVGTIDLTGDYPVDVRADVQVYRLDEHYVSPLAVVATGSLKRTTGTVQARYNNAPVSGDFVVSSLEKDVPFSANLVFDKIVLPYADDQAITLQKGVVQAKGIWSEIELRTNAHLTAKDIPNGQYTARTRLTPDGLTVSHLKAITPDGTLTATGKLDWRHDFYLKSTIRSQDYSLARAVPDEYQSYGDYLPSVLAGQLGFNYYHNDKGRTRYEIELAQDDGERLTAEISNPNTKNPPYQIALAWQNVRRANLPDVGEFISPQGKADILVDKGAVAIVANASLDKLADLPKGDYTADTQIQDEIITVRSATYKGAVGELSLDGVVKLPKDDKPLSYELNARTPKLQPNAYFGTPNQTPIQSLVGTARLIGRYEKSAENKPATHTLTLQNTDLTASLDNKQTVQFIGDGKAVVAMADNTPKTYQASLDGQLKTTGIINALADNALSLAVRGEIGKVTTAEIDKLTLSGKAGHLSGAGTVKVGDSIDWQLAVRGDKVDTAQFYAKSFAILTGDVASSGRYQDGKLIHSTLDFDGEVADNATALGKVQVNLVGSKHKFTINRLSYDGQAGTVNGTGWVDITKGVAGQAELVLQGLNVGRFIKGYDSALSGKLSAMGHWQDGEQSLDIREMDLVGTVKGEPVAASGQLSLNVALPKDFKSYVARLKKPTFNLDGLLGSRLARPENFYENLTKLGEQAGHLQDDLAKKDQSLRKVINQLKADNIKLQWGDNRFGLDGNEQKLSIAIDANDLTQLTGQVRGQVAGGVVLVGDDNSLPTVYSDLQINNVSMPNFAVRQGSLLARLVNLGNADSAVVVQGVGVVAFGRSFREARLDAKGTQEHHRLTGFVNDGNLQLHSRVEGGFDGMQYRGVVSEGRLQTRFGVLNQRQPTEISYELAGGRLAVAPHCWQTVSVRDEARGSLCLKEKLTLSDNSGHINAVIHRVDTAVFTPLLPSDLTIKAKLNGMADIRWGAGKPDIQLVLYSDGGQLGLRTDGLPDTTMGYDRVSVIAKSVPNGLKLRTDIKAGQAGDGYVDIIIDPYREQKPIAGTMALNGLNLAMFRPFFPAFRVLAGEANLSGTVGGTLKQPLLYGNANLVGGKMALADAPINLNDVNLTATIRGNQAKLNGDFKSGQGVGKLTGELGWHNELQAKFDVQGDNLDIGSPPLFSAKLSPHLQILLRPRQKYVDIKGVVAIPTATIRPPKDTGGAVGVSEDVIVIDRRISTNVEKLLQKVAPWSINTDIGVDLGDDVVFSGFGAKLPLAGAIHLTQTAQGTLQGRGVVQVAERRTVDFLGQNLELNYAQIRFNGDLENPRLSIEGVRQIDGQTVGVRVTGTASDPQIQVFNDAGLTEEQAMNALATGSLSQTGTTQISEQGFRSQVTNSLAAAGLSFGLQGTRGVTNEIGRALGLDSLVVDASGNANDANVNVTGYISPDLYVRYGVGVFNAETSLSMRYQLTRRVYVEATSATERLVDVVYRWRFK